MSYPLAGKHVSFDGRFLHGASRELARPTDVEEGYERVTFLVNVWLGYKPRGIDAFPEEAFDALTCVLSHTGYHTTASAMWTPILKDFCRRFSSPRVPRFQSPTSTPFNSASDAFQLHPDVRSHGTALRPAPALGEDAHARERERVMSDDAHFGGAFETASCGRGRSSNKGDSDGGGGGGGLTHVFGTLGSTR